MCFNKAACDLINVRNNGYRFAQFLVNEENKNLIGVRFWKAEYESKISNSVPLMQKESKGKPIGGVDIANSNLLKAIFGLVVANKNTTKFRVRRDEIFDHTLVIDVNRSIGKK